MSYTEFEDLDGALDRLYAGASVGRSFRQSVLGRLPGQPALRRPSLVPEILDFVAWAGVLAAAGILVVYAPVLLPIFGLRV